MCGECSSTWLYTESKEFSAVFGSFPGQLPLAFHCLTDDGLCGYHSTASPSAFVPGNVLCRAFIEHLGYEHCFVYLSEFNQPSSPVSDQPVSFLPSLLPSYELNSDNQ